MIIMSPFLMPASPELVLQLSHRVLPLSTGQAITAGRTPLGVADSYGTLSPVIVRLEE